MYHYDYITSGTCAQLISIDLDGEVVHNVSFMGGCNGNLKAIPILVEGMTVDNIEKMLSGVECGRRGTSCADQLAVEHYVSKGWDREKAEKYVIQRHLSHSSERQDLKKIYLYS